MRISTVIQLAMQYILVGIIGSIFVIGLFLIGYFLVYKKLMKGSKKLKLSKIALCSIFLIYITVVLGATIGSRVSNYSSVNLHLFSSYKDAYNNFSLGEWRNIILNILMFVPIGFLLPLIFKKCQCFYITYLAGFFLTLFIEILQLITKRGIFELDDILNNTLGCAIGYGIIMIFISLFKRKKSNQKHTALITAFYQIPLIISIIFISVPFINYNKQELGNLSINNNYKVNMSKINLHTKLNTNIDESQNNEYDDTIIFKSEKGDYSLWVNYKGLTTSFISFKQTEAKGKEKLTYEEVQAILNEFDIELPKDVDFKDNGDGNYSISLDMVKSKDLYIDGDLICTINENNTVSSFTNNIISYKPYKEYDILSLQEAYNEILAGNFKFYAMPNKVSNIEVIDANLIYLLDSKGFYQPVYDFTININENINHIYICALK